MNYLANYNPTRKLITRQQVLSTLVDLHGYDNVYNALQVKCSDQYNQRNTERCQTDLLWMHQEESNGVPAPILSPEVVIANAEDALAAALENPEIRPNVITLLTFRLSIERVPLSSNEKWVISAIIATVVSLYLLQFSGVNDALVSAFWQTINILLAYAGAVRETLFAKIVELFKIIKSIEPVPVILPPPMPDNQSELQKKLAEPLLNLKKYTDQFTKWLKYI